MSRLTAAADLPQPIAYAFCAEMSSPACKIRRKSAVWVETQKRDWTRGGACAMINTIFLKGGACLETGLLTGRFSGRKRNRRDDAAFPSSLQRAGTLRLVSGQLFPLCAGRRRRCRADVQKLRQPVCLYFRLRAAEIDRIHPAQPQIRADLEHHPAPQTALRLLVYLRAGVRGLPLPGRSADQNVL